MWVFRLSQEAQEIDELGDPWLTFPLRVDGNELGTPLVSP